MSYQRKFKMLKDVKSHEGGPSMVSLTKRFSIDNSEGRKFKIIEEYD